MTSYRKTMRQAREEMIQSQNENNLDEGKMSAAQIATLKKAYEPMRGKKISMTSGQKLSSIMDKVDDDKQALIQLVKADIPFVSQLAITRLITKHGMKGAEIRKMQEEVELDEASYALYHKDFSSAMQHSYKMAKKMYGITVDPKEIDDKVASGPKKPSEGKTNTYRLKGDKGAIQVQVYNKGGSKPFELNMYKEEVELDESKKALKKKSEKSGVSVGILSKVYDRGMAAWKTGHRPGTTPQQWALARVNSFLTGGGARKSDADLWTKAKASKKSKKEEVQETRITANKEQVQIWFESNYTRERYKDTYGEDWWWKLNEMHDAMLEKLGICCEDCVEEKKETGLMKFREMSKLNVWGEVIQEAEYQGRKVELNNPTRGDVKKFKVYVKNDKGNVVKVEYGDPNMEIKRDDPARRKSFRARHNCDNPGPKYKARYWSCKFWEKGKTVTDLMKG